ncbi:unnamed protein product, partial [Ectocarpus sp. 12 AP-2014]
VVKNSSFENRSRGCGIFGNVSPLAPNRCLVRFLRSSCGNRTTTTNCYEHSPTARICRSVRTLTKSGGGRENQQQSYSSSPVAFGLLLLAYCRRHERDNVAWLNPTHMLRICFLSG